MVPISRICSCENFCSQNLGKDGELFGVRDLASKAADNMAILAAMFQFFENIEQKNADTSSSINPDNMLKACRIISWHLSEAVSFFAEKNISEELATAIKLEGGNLFIPEINH
ncbi:DUF3987 domain-containing protein [Legionella israelensis]|uniref:DUF3987 domain-containing protein n=1 Tax=Legionella israelensis TaxID=454 RepID=UPI00117D2447|nr:DUF3987 domain-containing protein [Legionella israelensis]QDP71217.1 DUF3987 domain-containing protein [Legionella israelensis]